MFLEKNMTKEQAYTQMLYKLAELVQDVDAVNRIEDSPVTPIGEDELAEITNRVIEKVTAYEVHGQWPPKIGPLNEIMRFNS
jgi:hypothetical protein